MDSSDRYNSPRPGGAFGNSAGQRAWSVPVSRQIQDWTRGMEFNSTGRREVITERKTALPLFSAKGIRWDALMVTLLLILLLFTGILLADMQALHAGGSRIGKLSAGITSLEDSNSQLRQELSLAMNHSAILSRAESINPVNETVIVLSAAPEE